MFEMREDHQLWRGFDLGGEGWLAEGMYVVTRRLGPSGVFFFFAEQERRISGSRPVGCLPVLDQG